MEKLEKELQQAIVNYTVQNSGFEPQRDYIGLSGIADNVDAIIARYQNPTAISDAKAVRCYKGYQAEADLLKRICAVAQLKGWAFETGTELSMNTDGLLFKGHPDFTLNGLPCDIKTVPSTEHLPATHLDIPARVVWQMNAYMLLSDTSHCYIVYEARDTGYIRVYRLHSDYDIRNAILDKIEQITHKLNQLHYAKVHTTNRHIQRQRTGRILQRIGDGHTQ